jgi:hypothetical protein
LWAAIRRILALNGSAPKRAQPVDHNGGQPNQALAALGLGRIEAATAKKPD